MAISVMSESVLATKVNTEHILMDVTSAGVFVFTVLAVSQVLGDFTTLRAKMVPTSGQGFFDLYAPTLANCLSEPVMTLPAVVSDYQCRFTIQVNSSGVSGSGTGSAGPPYTWRIDKIN